MIRVKVVVVGVGKLGYKLAEAMVEEKSIDVTLIDKNPEVLESINEHMDVLTIEATGIDTRVLREINIEDYDLLIASTDSDETNTLVCSLAKKLGCKYTIARIRNPEYMAQLGFIKKEMGIDHIVNPDLATAYAMEKYLLKSYSFYSGDFASGKVQLIDFNIGHDEDIVGKKLMELNGFDKVLIAAITTDEGIIIPNGSTKLRLNDIIHIIGKKGDIEELSYNYGFNTVDKKIEDVMILGGSNISYYLAKSLEKQGISVKIIEKDREVAERLSEELDSSLIIYGDGTDINLLEEEELEKMDAFIGATGFDEQNMLMALMAKQAGVTKTLAKISKSNYNKIIDRLDIDGVLNPIYISASNILKFIRGGKVLSVSLLLGGEAEVTEVIVDKKSPFVNKKLKDLDIGSGLIIGAIYRNREVIIPKGDDQILANDRIVIFTLEEDVELLNQFISPKKGGFFNELWHHSKGSRNNTSN